MEKLILDEAMIESLKDYILNQEYAIGTKLLYVQNLRKIAKENKEIDYETLLKLHKKLKHPFQRAIFKIINDYCFINKIDFKISLPSIKKKNRESPEVLSLNEIRTIVDSTPEKYKLFIRSIFGFGAGLRISEAIGISWHRFDWDDWLFKENKDMNLLRTKKTEQERGIGVYLVKSTKRGKTYPVTVPKKLMMEYYNLAKKREILNEWGIPTLREPVFDFGIDSFNPELRKINPQVWKNKYIKNAYDWIRYNLIKRIYEPALGKRLKIHSMRHSRSSFLLEQGKPLEEISKLLGHEDIRTSMIYTRITLGKIKKDMEDVDTI